MPTARYIMDDSTSRRLAIIGHSAFADHTSTSKPSTPTATTAHRNVADDDGSCGEHLDKK